MNLNNTDLFQLIGLVIGFITLVITLWININQSKALRKQIRLQVFADYTKRYQEIKFKFPYSIYEEDFTMDSLSKDQQESLLKALRAYFDLCSEEFYLNEEKRVETSVWEMWKQEIIDSINKPAFREAWQKIRKEYLTYQAFVTFVENHLRPINLKTDT